MTSTEFEDITTRLCNLFNKELNETQMNFWFKNLKDKEAVIYRRAIGEYAKKNKYMPTISDILNEIRNLKPLEQPKAEKVECKACRGSGIVIYHKNGYEYAALCNCKNSIGKEYENKDSGYYIPKSTDVFAVGGTRA